MKQVSREKFSKQVIILMSKQVIILMVKILDYHHRWVTGYMAVSILCEVCIWQFWRGVCVHITACTLLYSPSWHWHWSGYTHKYTHAHNYANMHTVMWSAISLVCKDLWVLHRGTVSRWALFLELARNSQYVNRTTGVVLESEVQVGP